MSRSNIRDRLAKLTPEQQGALAARIQQSGLVKRDHGIPRRPTDVPVEMSFAQQRLWFMQQLQPENPFYNMPIPLRLTGRLDVGALQACLDALVARLAPCDLVLVEGYKQDPIPRIEVHRAGGDRPLLFPDDPYVIAVATDEPLETRLPCFGLDDAPAISRFITEFVRASAGRRLSVASD